MSYQERERMANSQEDLSCWLENSNQWILLIDVTLPDTTYITFKILSQHELEGISSLPNFVFVSYVWF